MSEHFDLDAGSWEHLCRAPLTMWLAMSGVDTVVDSPEREADAYEQSIEKEKRRHADDPLVQAVLAAAPRLTGPQRRATATVDPDALLRELAHVREILDHHFDPEQTKRFARVVMAIGYDVAGAANESLTGVGMGVSQPEEHFLAQAQRALGLHRG